ncbi:MAG TPA: DUF58 domain-containing protein [Acidimicrobiales bacterium]|nr:DUF58 domain-containing protein [Acidimicrobiales bacterium]
MTISYTSHRVAGYLTLVVAGLVGALLTGRPEPAILAAPFAVALAGGLALTHRIDVSADLEVDHDRALEGDDVTVAIAVTPPDAAVALEVSRGLSVRQADATAGGIVSLVVTPTRWGAYPVGRVAVRALDDMGLFWTETTFERRAVLRVYPSAERLRRGVGAADPEPLVGRHPSRARGEGVEFADLRPYSPGDRARSVNWRATARRGEVWVNDRHPERSSAVVLLVDTLDTRGADRAGVLDRTVRATAAAADVYTRSHDRVGLLAFGGNVRWLRPGSGRAQLLRIVDALLDTEVLLTGTFQGGTHLPLGALPPRALLLAITPLDHDAVVDTLADLRARGFDVAALVPAPDAGRDDASPSRRGDGDHGDEFEREGARLDTLLRDMRRLRLERLGIVVADTRHGVAAGVEEVELCRRRMPRVRI